jgi:hypothetical protein
MRTTSAVPLARIERVIVLIRNQRVILDSDIAALYGVETRALVQAVMRNRSRFPADFMFQLADAECIRLKSQTVISNGRGGRRSAPYAFTEQGVAMLSSVLRSRRAVAVNIAIMRTFVRVRRLLAEHGDLVRRLDELEARYDGEFRRVFDAIRQLMTPPPPPPRRRIGFHVDPDELTTSAGARRRS